MMLRRSWPLMIALAVSGCGSDEDETIEVAAASPEEVAAASVEPEHEGTVVAAGRYPVEVVPHASGEVYAYVLGDAPPPGEVEITVRVPVAGRSTGRPVRLRWSPRQHRYEGRVRRVEIVEGPVDVVVVVGGVEYTGHVDVCVLLPAIVIEVVEPHGKWKGKHHGWGHGHGHGHGHVIHVR